MSNPKMTLTAAQVASILAAAEQGPALPCEPDPVIDGLMLRRRLGRKDWGVPLRRGCCGWSIDGLSDASLRRIIVTADHQSDGVNWIHASISGQHGMPTYEDLKLMHAAVFGDRWAYQVFSPPAQHINIHAHVLHLFGRVDGVCALPDFGRFGTI